MIGARIARFRSGRKMSMAELARRAGVSKPTVWAWENGKASPRAYRLAAIASALGVSRDELLEGNAGSDRAYMQWTLDVEIRRCRTRIAMLARTSPDKVDIRITD